jgi:hypothetical protein
MSAPDHVHQFRENPNAERKPGHPPEVVSNGPGSPARAPTRERASAALGEKDQGRQELLVFIAAELEDDNGVEQQQAGDERDPADKAACESVQHHCSFSRT